MSNHPMISEIEIYNVAEGEATLVAANEAYHNGDPIMSDPEYDILWNKHLQARSMRPDDPFWTTSILGRVGAPPPQHSGFRQVAHPYPLLSLTNVFELKGAADPEADLKAWLEKVLVNYEAQVVAMEPKIDGLSLGILYNEGQLVSATTRGDGEIGDDVTENVLAAKLLPPSIPYTGPLFLRGEVFIYWSTFLAANAAAKAAGLDEMANPRNAASGALRLHNPAEVAKRNLALLVYDVVDGLPTAKTHNAALLAVRAMGIKTVDPIMVEWFAGREGGILQGLPELDSDIPMDGKVFKINRLSARLIAGMGTTSPNWAIAYKHLPEQCETTLLGINVQVGTTGVLTPVADLEPVFVAGSTIASATLHNEKYINTRHLHPGARVMIEKAGHVIPRVDRLADPTLDRSLIPPFDLVKHLGGKCPSCGSGDIQQLPGQVAWRCMNTDECPAQLATRILRFGSRAGLDLDQLGDEIAIALADSGRIRVLVDILRLDIDFLTNLSWRTEEGKTMSCGALRAAKIIKAINAAEYLPLHRWLYALCIPTVGENTPKELARLYMTMEDLCAGSQDSGGIIHRIAVGEKKDSDMLRPFAVSAHIGPVTAGALVKYFSSEAGQRAREALGSSHVRSIHYAPIPQVTADRPLTGKVFVVTGTLSQDRNAIKAKIEARGGKCSDSVSSKTDYVVAGENAGSKLDKAKKLSIPVLNEPELDKLLAPQA